MSVQCGLTEARLMINIYNEDCLSGMKKIASGSVDAIICDPPFGTTSCPFDVRIPFEPMWEQFLRVTKENAAIVLFSQMPFGAELIMSQKKIYRYKWVYKKVLPVGHLNAKKMPLRIHEDILVFYRCLPTYNPQFTKGKPYTKKSNRNCFSANYNKQRETVLVSDGQRYPTDVLEYRQPYCSSEQNYHPQQKPVPLLEYLIRTYTDEGETVLDATMGSGSTGVACMNTGRNFIGFELDKKFYDIAQKRISEALATKQQELFKLSG